MRLFLMLICFGFLGNLSAQQNDVQAIRHLLNRQQDDWNRGDIQAFMEGYWRSDSLMFIGSKGVTYGFNNTWERYKKNYDSREKMGSLRFDLIHINRLSPDVFMVVGKWQLTRTVGDIGGHYTLILRKIDGSWVIVSDHTS